MVDLIRWGLVLIFCTFLASCSDGALQGAAKMDQAKVWLEKVNFKVNPKVNQDSPVAVHLIIIYDDGVMGQVSGMTAEQYFQGESQLRKDHANDIDITTWEVVPGQEVDSETISMTKAYGKGAFVFARYKSPDANRAGIADEQEITIHLDEKDFYITKDR